MYKLKTEQDRMLTIAKAVLIMNDLHEKLMTIEDLSEYLQVKKRTLYDWVKKGRIPAIKTIGQWRFQREQIDTWLEEHRG